MEICLTRNERQQLAQDKYRATARASGKLAGTFNHCTGFGKTRQAKNILDKLIEKQGEIHFIVVVPTNNLKEQWEGLLKLNINYEVLTVQGLISRADILTCDFLILDEIHKMAADQFIRVFELIEYKHILGLTATYDRMDGRHILIDKFCPVIDTITLDEARYNGWVADYMQYNWGIEFDATSKAAYDNIHKQVSKYMAYFDHDLKSIIGCATVKGAKFYLQRTTDSIPSEEEAKVLSAKANICRNLIAQRLDMLNSAACKIDATIEALHYLNLKTVTFGLSKAAADTLANKVSGSFAYHSGITPKSKLPKILQAFINDEFQWLHTAKKADLGLDVPGLQCAIIYAGTNDPGTNRQRNGRVTRKEGDKFSIILTIYIKGTKDEWTVKNRQKGSNRIKWIDSLREIKL